MTNDYELRELRFVCRTDGKEIQSSGITERRSTYEAEENDHHTLPRVFPNFANGYESFA